MNINWAKLLTADFTLGKIINLRKALADSVGLLIREPTCESLELTKLMLTVKPQYTMVTNKNLVTLYKLIQRVNDLGLTGDIVECGVWNGGSAAVMGWANNKETNKQVNRTIWLFDSFEGLPRPTEKDGRAERQNYFEGWCKGDVNKVKRIFTMVGVPIDMVKIVPGWFEDTLPTAPVDRIAILHIDSDWYDSVKLVLEAFYEKVVPGGFVILNDYGAWPGCNRAISDYVVEHNLCNIEMNIVEPSTGAYFQKPRLGHLEDI
jgi:O-methyltransferase